MNSRIDTTLCLVDNGMTVRAKGPIINWEPDEVSAVVTVTVKQLVGPPRQMASATGSSKLYLNGATRWAARAVVTAGPPLHYGQAMALATATIEHDDGTVETYTWTVLTELVECNEDDQEQDDDG